MIRFRSLFVVLALFCGHAHAETLTGLVVGVADGDTITVLDAERQQHKIRLAGIDAPEKKQAFGQKSKASLSSMVFGKAVRVEARKKDRYGRTIGRVWVAIAECTLPGCPKTLDAGMALLTQGLAWHYKQYAKEQPPEERGQYSFAEEEARIMKIGLWRDANPMPPWEWRHGKKSRQSY